MAKIMDFRVSVPGDDPVKTEAVKTVLLTAIRALGEMQMRGEHVEGGMLDVAETTAFFNAASVKTFVIQSPRKNGAAISKRTTP